MYKVGLNIKTETTTCPNRPATLVINMDTINNDGNNRHCNDIETDSSCITTIDGSYGEGGGQILRNACAYAAILGENVRIVNIRAGRSKPGLRPQHLVGLKLLAAASGGKLAEGNQIGSTEILFLVENDNTSSLNDTNSSTCCEHNREYIGDTQTAGSVCLLLQAVFPLALLRSRRKVMLHDIRNKNNDDDDFIRFILKGGTDAAFAPPFDYFRYIFLSILQNNCGLGEKIEHNISMIRRGFYPRGGGEIRVAIPHLSSTTMLLSLPPIRLVERGEISGITIRVFSAGRCPSSAARTLSVNVKNILLSYPIYKKIPIKVIITQESSKVDTTAASTSATSGRRGRGRSHQPTNSECGLLIVAKTDTGCVFGGSAVGSPKVSLIETATLATNEVIQALHGGGCVDDYLQDQLILYMTLAEGVSEIVTNSLTPHTRTAIWLASQMVPSVRFEIIKLVAAGYTQNEGTDYDYGDSDSCDIISQRIIPGRHRIRCHGIGFRPTNTNNTSIID